jgi:hypothetical protein
MFFKSFARGIQPYLSCFVQNLQFLGVAVNVQNVAVRGALKQAQREEMK